MRDCQSAAAVDAYGQSHAIPSQSNRRRRDHVDLRVAIIVIKRFEFLFKSVCSDVQVASDDVR